mmetsp:Transcript_3570/g.6133  ORF Transcript_3570/g.6133 Transcript_3570/m.6133 type:complete len:219 (-) Transcript_3570:534-1190(-)
MLPPRTRRHHPRLRAGQVLPCRVPIGGEWVHPTTTGRSHTQAARANRVDLRAIQGRRRRPLSRALLPRSRWPRYRRTPPNRVAPWRLRKSRIRVSPIVRHRGGRTGRQSRHVPGADAGWRAEGPGGAPGVQCRLDGGGGETSAVSAERPTDLPQAPLPKRRRIGLGLLSHRCGRLGGVPSPSGAVRRAGRGCGGPREDRGSEKRNVDRRGLCGRGAEG